MTKFGTGLSRLLSAAMWLGLALAALGVVAGLLVGAFALIDPSVFAEARGQINGQPVYLREPERALAAAAVIVVACLFAGAVLWQLRGMLGSAARGAPFTHDNVRRLQFLGGLFAAVFAMQLAALTLPEQAQGLLNLREGRVDVTSLLSALLALVPAEVFREGVRLREEAEGTI